MLNKRQSSTRSSSSIDVLPNPKNITPWFTMFSIDWNSGVFVNIVNGFSLDTITTFKLSGSIEEKSLNQFFIGGENCLPLLATLISLSSSFSNPGLSNSSDKKLDHLDVENFSFCLFIISLGLILLLMAIQKFNVIKNDALIPIEVSGAFYKRYYEILIAALDREEDPKQTLINIDTPDQLLTINEGLIQTLMIFVKSVEAVAYADKVLYTDEIEKEIITEDPSES